MVVALAALVGLRSAGASTGLALVVNSTSDAVDANVGNGICETSSGSCTLRAAVQEANAAPGADVIQVPGGTYELAIRPLNQNDVTTGDLDITDSLTIAGAGSASTILDGGPPPAGSPPEVRGVDRLFEILVDGGTVTFSALTISDGYAAEHGGAILNSSTAALTLVDSVVTGSVAGETGGGIDNRVGGRIEVLRSTLTSNYAGEDGSALNNNSSGTVEIRDSVVSGNSAEIVGLDETLRGAGAVSNHAEHDELGTITVLNSVITDNASGGGRSGAGISNHGAGSLVVERTSFSNNQAHGNGGAIFNGKGQLTVTASTFSENAAKGGGGIASAGGVVDVRDSSFSKNTAADWGGGILNSNQGGMTIRRNTFRENVGLNGGGFANEGNGLVVVEDSTFTKNSALESAALVGGEGGGMHSNSGGEVVLTGGTIIGNSAANGGGLTNEGGGTITITGTRFSANTADERGGGILVEGGAVRMVAIDVVGNLSNSAEEGGGGISYAGDKSISVGESAAIEGSRIRDNKSDGDGGGIDSRGDGPLVITTTAITGNSSLVGGAIHHVGDAPLHVTRSTLSGNSARHGGGVFTDGDGEATLENTTVSGNVAADFGGGVLVSSRLTLRNSTVTRNSAPSGGGVNNGGGDTVGDGSVFLANAIVSNNPAGGNCAGTITSRGGNVENTNTCQLTQLSDQPGTDPLLGPLADNGGPTQTHALLAGSPAQESAACTELDPCPPIDQRGIERPRFARSDAGAYESELTPGGGGSQPCAGRTERPVTADYDTWVSQSSPSSNFGNDSTLKVRGGAERALVHFSLPPSPPGCKLVGATLRLYASAATEGLTLQAHRLASAWSELGATWSNQPPIAGPAATTLSGLGLVEWGVHAQTLEMYALGSHGFVISDDAGGGAQQSFHSREKGTDRPPELVLVFDDPDNPPPPGECPTTPQLFSADRDSWVSQSSSANNFGTDSSLKVKSQVGINSRALVRFPLPALPSGCTTVASAVLRLEASSAKEARTLEALQLALPWSEMGVTWSNQPPATGPAAATSSGQGVLEWNVTPQTLGIYTEANHGLLIRDAAEDGVGDEQAFDSREKGPEAAPKLLVTFDDSTPETTIESGPASPSETTSAAFVFSSDRDDSAFECSLDDAPFHACASPHAVSGLAHGKHAFEVRATRRVRAIDPTPALYEWAVALPPEPPETSVSGPASPSASPSATFTFAADDPNATFECSLDAAAFAACTSPAEYDSLGDGDHEFRVRAVGPFGSVDPTPASHRWTVAVPPETTIGDRPLDPTNSTSARFAFGGSDNGTSAAELAFECSLDEAAFASCASPRRYEALGAGSHTFEVRATDLAGNTDPSPASYSWTVDTDPPETAIDSAPADPSNDASPSFEFSSEAGARFECRLDGGEWEGCESPQGYAEVADGAHEFQVRATDAAGNTDAGLAGYSWTVDTVAPRTTIDSAPADPTNDASAGFAFSSEAGASFECRLDGGAWAGCESPHMYAALADGVHAFDVRASDAAGNVDATAARHAWTVDTIAPQTTIESGPAALTNSPDASFAFSSERGASFECRLDGRAWEPCESPRTYANLADGDHSVEVRASDAAGNNDSSPAGYFWTVDTIAPETAIDSAPADPSNDDSPSFALSSEVGASFECRLVGGDWDVCFSPQTYAALAEGAHSFEVRATDAAANTDASPANHSWTVDTVAPETTIEAGPPALTNAAEATFAFSSEPDASFQCRLDEDAWERCRSPHGYAQLADGAHEFAVRASDAAGNVDASPAGYSWTVDTVAPETTIESGPPATTRTTRASFSFSASETRATLECSLDGGPFAACSSPREYSNLAPGAHRFRARATDEAGNLEPEPASYDWTILASDTTAPDTAITAGPANPSNVTSAAFHFSGSDDETAPSALRFQCRVDSDSPDRFAPCSSPSHADVADGSHTFQVRAIDGDENVDPTPAAYTWTVDTIAPETTIDAGPPPATQSTSATFPFSTPEAGASFECSLDGAAFAACVSPKAYSALAPGTHGFRVRAIDPAGNADSTPASHSWTVDTAPPQTAIDSGPPDLTNSTSSTFAFSANELSASFQCSLDEAAFAACSSPKTYTGLGSGAHSFQVRATDPAGNTDASPAAYSWTVDTTAPDTNLTGGPSGPVAAASASFSFASEPGAAFDCSLDDAPFADCASPKTYAGLADGPHTFAVRARDAAGNHDPSPATRSWTVDTTPPDTTITDGPSGSVASAAATFSFISEPGATFECSLDTSEFTPCTSPASYADLAPAEHRFRVRAGDSLGNVDLSPASRTWTVVSPSPPPPPADTRAPETAIDSVLAPRTRETRVEIAFSSDEPGSTFECSLDGAPFAGCASPKSYEGLDDRDHLFEVRARDAAGNVDFTPAARGWTVDMTPPETMIGSGPPVSTSDRQTTLTFSAGEPGAAFECSLDAPGFDSCSSPLEATVGLGDHSFRVRARDDLGNVDPTPAVWNWTVTSPPPPPSPSPPPAAPPPPPVPPPPSPPAPLPVIREPTARASIGTGPVRVDARGVARVPITCSGNGRLGCRGRLSLVRTTPRQTASGEGVVTLGARQFAIAAGSRVALTVRLNAPARRLLERSGTLRARVVVAWREAGRKRTISRPVSLQLQRRR